MMGKWRERGMGAYCVCMCQCLPAIIVVAAAIFVVYRDCGICVYAFCYYVVVVVK